MGIRREATQRGSLPQHSQVAELVDATLSRLEMPDSKSE